MEQNQVTYSHQLTIFDGRKSFIYRFNQNNIENQELGTQIQNEDGKVIRIGKEDKITKFQIIISTPLTELVGPLHCQLLINKINDPLINQTILIFQLQHLAANSFETAIRLPAEPKDINKIEKGDKFILAREYYIVFNNIIDIAVNPEEIVRNVNNELIENSNLPLKEKEIMKVNCQDNSIDLTQFGQYCAIFITIQQRQKGKIDQTKNKYKCIFIEQDKEFVITRNFISDTSRTISLEHATLQLTNERKLFIIDNSQNGTEKLLKENEIYPLSYNESFYIGNYKYVISQAQQSYFQDKKKIQQEIDNIQKVISSNLSKLTSEQISKIQSSIQEQDKSQIKSEVLKDNYQTNNECLERCYQLFNETPYYLLKSSTGYEKFYKDLTELENITNILFTSLKTTSDLEKTDQL